LPNVGARPRELARTMAPHPLSYQELPYDPEYTLYNNRLTPESLNHASDDEMYWKVRTEVIFRHTGELPIEISGPDAERLLGRVFTRDVSRVRVGRCSYQFACYHDGGMITDGVLLRLGAERFWMAQADGDLFSWYRAHAAGLDVKIHNPNVWVSQIQGPRALDVLAAVLDGPMPDPFRYFDCAEVSIAGQPCVISRSGFTNELGWEVYLLPESDIPAIGDQILKTGERFGMILTGTPVFRARRIEAGLLNAGSDFGVDTTPFDVGLGHMVEFDHRDFIGRAALEKADRACRTWGMKVSGGVALLGRTVTVGAEVVGRVCSSGFSPFQGCGVCIVRMDDPVHGPGSRVEVEAIDGSKLPAELCALPMYDEDRLIPRGKRVDIPTRPVAAE
jgi:aminomethyltransferase